MREFEKCGEMLRQNKTSWYRPASAVIHVPATPNAELAGDIQEIITEDVARLGLTAKAIETGDKSLKQHLVF